jgi:hypothetical protein
VKLINPDKMDGMSSPGSDPVNEGNLLEHFRVTEWDDPAELSEIVMWHFGGALPISEEEVCYGKVFDPKDGEISATSFSLKFVYSKSNSRRIWKILPGPRLTKEDLAALQKVVDNELKEPPLGAVTTVPLFAGIPVNGCYRHENRFQLLPVPADAPKPTIGFGGHPFLLQVRFRPSVSRSMLHGFRSSAASRKIQLLLNALLDTDISSERRTFGSQCHWVVPMPTEPGSSENTIHSKYGQGLYTYPGMNAVRRSGEFIALEGIPALEKVDAADYYGRTPSEYGERFLQIPANLETLLKTFFNRTPMDQESFLRACLWLEFAHTAYYHSTSACFTSLVSAIESLRKTQKSLGPCPECKNPRYPKSVTESVQEFIDDFAPEISFREARAWLYYKNRSALVHGNNVFYSDRTFFPMGLTPDALRERTLILELAALVRVILVNWLDRDGTTTNVVTE